MTMTNKLKQLNKEQYDFLKHNFFELDYTEQENLNSLFPNVIECGDCDDEKGESGYCVLDQNCIKVTITPCGNYSIFVFCYKGEIVLVTYFF